jgi:hypothetical protein
VAVLEILQDEVGQRQRDRRLIFGPFGGYKGLARLGVGSRPVGTFRR